MPHVTGEERNQLFMISLEEMVPQDSFVRVIDAFVDAIDMESFGFAHVRCKDEGRPSFHPAVLMKLYLYGYRYGIRTSRKLEREAALNLEAMWLTAMQAPRYKTIADFRKLHSKSFRGVFRSFVSLLRQWELADGQTIAIDSFKIRAQNSLKNNLNQKKLERHLEYIDNKIAEYEAQLDAADSLEEQETIAQKLDLQQQRKQGYQALEQQLQSSGEEQISLTDPDARAVVLHRNIVNVGYNIQAASDSKHKLLVEYDTGAVNDTHALSSMAIASKTILQRESMDVLADKGYHTGEELQRCQMENIVTYVSPKDPAAPDTGLYPVTAFVYNSDADSYRCPAGQSLTSNQVWYSHSSRSGQVPFRFRRYTTKACRECLQRKLCTQGKVNGRAIDRSEYAAAVEGNNYRVTARSDYYKLRQQITEHPFGTLKRQRGFTFTLMRGKEKVLGEVGLEFIAYNLTRCATVLGLVELRKALKKCCFSIFGALDKLFSGHLRILLLATCKTERWAIQKISIVYRLEDASRELILSH